ncbi:MAG TPA: hypothetical protein VIJ11_10975 [Galbitalea sp.]
MTTEPVADHTEKARPRYGWASLVVAVVFGLLYAYVLWNAIGNLVNLPKEFGSVTPWWLLVLDVAVPVVAFAAAWLVGRRGSLGARAVFFLIGFAVVACSTIGSIAYVQSHFGLI